MTKFFKEIAKQFQIEGELLEVKPLIIGNINNTFIVSCKQENEATVKYILQKINTNVFSQPHKLMTNIKKITQYLHYQYKIHGENRQSLQLIETLDNKSLFTYTNSHGEKEYYRMYNYIINSTTYNTSTDELIVFNTGKAFGHFQRFLIDYPLDSLEETIPDFHNTPKRYQTFLNDIKINAANRVMDVSKEILFFIINVEDLSKITTQLNKGLIPLRVTHNDTKVNNVMMDITSGDFLTVIDLDTVMPGSSLYDFGDGIRSAASNTCEDDTNLDNVFLRMDLFKSFTRGYLSEMASLLTKQEVLLLGESIKILTLELGMRFLNDYINGDTYFKINPQNPNHNLDRARNQIKLAQDIENKMSEINEFILDCYLQITK